MEQIAIQLRQHYTGGLLALGVYGSLARGTDGPFSDIEMHCVIEGEGIEACFEWSTGPWKAEVDVYSPDVLLSQAAEVDGDWSITHGAYATVQALYDPGDFFSRLRKTVFSPSEAIFHNIMERLIVGEIYEMVGKIRNACAATRQAPLASYTTKLANPGACLVGLYHRHLYSTSSIMLDEALELIDLPSGFAALCQQVVSGRLDNPARILALTDQFWSGVEAWATPRGLKIETSLDELLDDQQ